MHEIGHALATLNYNSVVLHSYDAVPQQVLLTVYPRCYEKGVLSL